jgi:hypothetical protein
MPGRFTAEEYNRPPPEPVVLEWPEFQVMFFEAYFQGEHIAIVGPTGSGKTALGLSLCRLIGMRPGKDGRPSRVTVLQYKPQDDTLRKILPQKEWPVLKGWPPAYGQEHNIVWPRGKGASKSNVRQRAVFLPLLDQMYDEGGQSVYIPEAAHFERPYPNSGLGMGGTMEEFWTSARSNKVGVISDTQRPRHVTRSMWTEPSWLVIYPVEDEDDLKHVAGLSGQKMAVYSVVPKLGEHEFLCIRRQRDKGAREIYVSKVEMPKPVKSPEK